MVPDCESADSRGRGVWHDAGGLCGGVGGGYPHPAGLGSRVAEVAGDDCGGHVCWGCGGKVGWGVGV